ncbi:SDR family NAD(P)-dependent oxidoreductase [Blastopirellula marina]|uniref:Probable 3-oxoacyl-[acyl-carrier-protein] reductase n=1 Tax=Blastopirellula marina DSM 3645 TaxID=314230 RepID=A3ZYY2_9BACT|nr:SDR family oxidoreductase [Blastopirellula marina]EAQ78347.1 probable 3-oxoacyl-[acyl-carrier-protein] reductase [Blastopirellula marina DSM 3645]
MDLQLTGKTALVTGSTGGIGLAIATSLAREGAKTIINGRSEKSVAAALVAIRSDVPDADLVALVADNGTAQGCQTTIEAFPAVDILVNNLGIYEAVGFFDETDEAWQRLFEINIMSGVRLSRHYLAGMLSRDAGRVIFISSESGVSPAPEMAHYSATKTMQLSISRSLAELTKGTAVTVNSVLPGSTMTESVQQFVADVFPGLPSEEAEKKFIVENRPTSLIQRFIDPNEIGDAVTFVCSPNASAINGAALRVDGGIVKSVV